MPPSRRTPWRRHRRVSALRVESMILDSNTPTTRGRGRSRSLAALLSFSWPGLGQFYLGNRRLAALFAIPALLILLILTYQLRQGVVVFGARFADPAFSLAAIAIV